MRSRRPLSGASTPSFKPDPESPDIELEHLLEARGWVAADRAHRCVLYEWPRSEPGGELDCTHVFIDFSGQYSSTPYRVSLVDGERHMFTDRSSFIANLDAIEARRCPNCGPITPRLHNEEATREREALSKNEASRSHGCRRQRCLSSRRDPVGTYQGA